MGDRIGSDDLSELIAFDNAYGFPDIYFMTGQICSLLNNLWAEKRRGPEDFVPYFARDKPARQSAKEMMSILKAKAEPTPVMESRPFRS